MPERLARHYRSGALLRFAWQGGRLTAVGAVAGGETDLCAAPGLLDLQVNGYGGLDFSTPAGVAGIAALLARHGVTRFLPTVITAAPEVLEGALRAIASALEADPGLCAAVPGIHLEGPYLSAEDGPRGAHPRAFVRDPDLGHWDRLQAAAGGRIRVLTLAPERPGAPELIARASAAGVVVALGHTAAGGAEIRRAAAAGARLCTHLGNGLAASIDRHRNPLWPQLACGSLWASFIADGEHLPADALTAMLAAKGLERSILCSDAVREAGLPPGEYTGVGGTAVRVRASGRVELAGTPYLAGSGAHLAHCVAFAAACGAVRLPEAIELASLRPAQLLGLPAGALAPGGDCFLYRVGADGGLDVRLTVRAGEVVYAGAG